MKSREEIIELVDKNTPIYGVNPYSNNFEEITDYKISSDRETLLHFIAQSCYQHFPLDDYGISWAFTMDDIPPEIIDYDTRDWAQAIARDQRNEPKRRREFIDKWVADHKNDDELLDPNYIYKHEHGEVEE